MRLSVLAVTVCYNWIMRVLGIDIGGTFTDFVLFDGSRLVIHKRLSSPHDPAESLLAGVAELGGAQAVIHGSTVATNALLERRGAPTALVTTRGFADVLAIGRGTRPSLYDLEVQIPPPLVPRKWRFEVDERLLPDGSVLRSLDDLSLQQLVELLSQAPVEAIAICLLHSYANPDHERRISEALRAWRQDLFISASHRVLPVFREYERTSTTVINAYVGPLMGRYLTRLEQGLAALGIADLRIVGSDGGSMSVPTATELAARTALSGPAAGVVGARYVAGAAGYERLITFDMGGTSTDVALCPGTLPLTADVQIGGLPLALPAIDIHTVGAGGGSLARVDAGGALRVGPQSAGADPGPACYGKGEAATVTDANLILGRLPYDHFLGGRMLLDVERARAALLPLAYQLGCNVEEAALGVIRVANAAMERAIRTISVERGEDPRSCTLVAFGGAGPLHAAALAEDLAIPRVLVPRYPGVLSALGMIAADTSHDTVVMVLRPWHAIDPGELARLAAHLAGEASAILEAEGFGATRRRLQWSLELRYNGQGYELAVPVAETHSGSPSEQQFAEAALRFHQIHECRYGHAMTWRPIDLVALRCRSIGLATPPPLRPDAPPPVRTPQPIAVRPAILNTADRQDVPIYERESLGSGVQITGPAIVVQLDATTVVPPGWQLIVDDQLNLVLERV